MVAQHVRPLTGLANRYDSHFIRAAASWVYADDNAVHRLRRRIPLNVGEGPKRPLCFHKLSLNLLPAKALGVLLLKAFYVAIGQMRVVPRGGPHRLVFVVWIVFETAGWIGGVLPT